MQILILAAGESSRFWPFSEVCHKSLLKIGNKTVLERVIDKLGEREIILVVNPKVSLPDSIKRRKNVVTVSQEEPKGMGDAIFKARNLIKDEFLVIMPYYININDVLSTAEKAKSPAVALKEYKEGDEKTHGIAAVKNGKIMEIREKEKFNGANYSIVGMYKLNKEMLSLLGDKTGVQYGFESMLDKAAKGGRLGYFNAVKTPSLKYVTDLLSFRDYVYADIKKEGETKGRIYGKNVFVEKSAVMGKNVRIGNNVSIKGRTCIGDNSFIGDNSLIRDSIIGENVEIGFSAEIARSIIMDGTHMHSGFVGDSIIGENCRLGANFITGNKRIDRKSISIEIKSERYDTGLARLGAVIGNNVKTGINSSTMPGTIIGNNSIIGSNTEVKNRIGSNRLVYSKSETVEKKL